MTERACGICSHGQDRHRAARDGCEVRYADDARCYCPGYRARISAVCTCDGRQEFVCHDIRDEPHLVGCPRWGTPRTATT